ncbi:MAG: hypothetical protein ABSG26_02000 [Bryobacteraceae bacterium]|jgi:hypothetical protein
MAKQPRRKPTPPEIEKIVLTKSRRRCALCFHLDGDTRQKKGQIAHLDHRRAYGIEDNLAWLCLDHHSEYDSVTSQHKNYTIAEVKDARQALYWWIMRQRSSHLSPTQSAKSSRPAGPRPETPDKKRKSGAETSDQPVVMLSPRTGIELQVEALRAEAINVRLVPVESKNYSLRSEVVRCLRTGAPAPLVLHCRPKDKVRSTASPHDFFTDLTPTPDSHDAVEMAERVLRYLTEEQLAFTFELAYSSLSGAQHFRSAFRVRWDQLTESIVDVEPLGIRPDDEPPSAAPPNVLAVSATARLKFQCWHGGAERGFPSPWGDGTPTWIAVENTQSAPARTATNVKGRLEFIASDGTVRFVVPEVSWYEVKAADGAEAGQVVGGRKKAVEIEGGCDQSFALFIQSDQRKLLVYSDFDEAHIGDLGYDKWQVRIQVTSEDAYGFEGRLSFTFTRRSLIPDQPAFTKVRDIPPRAQQD